MDNTKLIVAICILSYLAAGFISGCINAYWEEDRDTDHFMITLVLWPLFIVIFIFSISGKLVRNLTNRIVDKKIDKRWKKQKEEREKEEAKTKVNYNSLLNHGD